MHSTHIFSKLLVAHIVLLILVFFSASADAQFWRVNAPSDRDLFALETRAAMAPGICYKEVVGKTADPNLRMRVISYCCDGYVRHSNLRTMKCEPICTEDCTNGICSAPDVCECYPGFERRGGRCEEI